MRELPISYLAPMVRAVLDGNKTQTRRPMKPQPPSGFHPSSATVLGPIACSYGKLGDRLWVREAWRVSSAYDDLPPSKLPTGLAIEYLADGPTMFDGKTRPASHMPRWASRIRLEITEVQEQRLLDISEADALAEGIVKLPLTIDSSGTWWSADSTQPRLSGHSPVVASRRLWRSIYGDDSCMNNPWVWVVSFKLIPLQSQNDN